MGFCGKDVVLHVKRQILWVGEQQEEVLEHLGEEERVHPERGEGEWGRGGEDKGLV